MSNFITIELCAEDRTRIDKLIAALEYRNCDKCVKDAIEYTTKVQQEATAKKADATEALKNAPQEAEASPPTNTIQKEEKPAQTEPAPAAPAKTVSHDELMAKVIELSAKDVKLKAQVRDIVLSYAPRVKAVPEDKLSECYERLAALEG